MAIAKGITLTVLVSDQANAIVRRLDSLARELEFEVSDLRENWQGHSRHVTSSEARYLKLMTNFWSSLKTSMAKFEELT